MSTVREVGVEWRFATQPVQEPVSMAAQLRERGLTAKADELARKCNSILLSRGRRPSRGCVLMLKSDYDKIVRPHDCRHTLVINAEKLLVVDRLCVTRVIALVPGFKPPRSSAPGKEQLPEVVDTTPVIVEFADARHYASELTAINEVFNLLKPTGEPYQNTFRGPDVNTKASYKVLCNEIWEERNEQGRPTGLRNLFKSSLKFFVGDEDLILAPENLQFLGLSAWDALWVVLDLAGWTFAFNEAGGASILQLGNPIDDEQLQEITSEATRATIVDAKNVQDDFLPEKIRVTTTQRDYQFDFQQQTITTGDHYSRFPTFTEEFETDQLIGRTTQKHPIASDTVKQLWGSVPLFIGDLSLAARRPVVQRHLKDIAIRYLRHINEGQIREFEWFGLRQLLPSKFFSGILFRDHGGLRTHGLNSAFAEPEWIDGDIHWELPWSGEEARPGALTRDAVQYGREIYGRVVDVFPSDISVTGPGKVVFVVEKDSWATVSVFKGRIRLPIEDPFGEQIINPDDGVTFTPNGLVRALNVTGKPIRGPQRCFGKWNYQLGLGGEWCIIRAGGSELDEIGDWEARSIFDAEPVRAAQDDGLVVVNRLSMLRLIRPTAVAAQVSGEVAVPDKGEFLPAYLQKLIEPQSRPPSDVPPGASADIDDATTVGVKVDMQHGPPNTVLWTAGADLDKDVIHWTDGPVVSSMRLTTGFLKFGEGDKATRLGPPARRGGGAIRLPTPPERSDMFLVSGRTSGGCTETEFLLPGVDCTIKVASECFDVDTFMDYFCEFVENCISTGDPFAGGTNPIVSECTTGTLTYEKGLLLSGPDCTIIQSRGGAKCDDVPVINWNPVTFGQASPTDGDSTPGGLGRDDSLP